MWNILATQLQKQRIRSEELRRAEWDRKNLAWLEEFRKEQNDKLQIKVR
jgi:hypothetical protein